MVLVFGALLGFISVAFGAFAEHGLRDGLALEQWHLLMTAIRYNQVHAVVISGVGLALLSGEKLANVLALRWSGILFIIGTLLFSVSIFLSVLFNSPAMTNVTPLGGMSLMAGWLSLLFAGVSARKNSAQ